MTTLANLFNTVALDVAGLGLLGAGAFSLITGKGGSAAPTTLLSLGGTYLGLKLKSASSSSSSAS